MGIPINEEMINRQALFNSTLCQFLIKIEKAIKKATKAISGVAILISINNDKRGMAMRASPNPKVDRVRAAKNTMLKIIMISVKLILF